MASVEEGAREAVVTTATYLGGAGAGLVLLTTIMQTGLEDLLSVVSVREQQCMQRCPAGGTRSTVMISSGRWHAQHRDHLVCQVAHAAP